MRNPNLEPVLRQIYSDRNVGTIRTSNVQQTNGTELNVNSTHRQFKFYRLMGGHFKFFRTLLG
ncbi:hypothetical protein BLOT_016359 [Blomia tropicalis]|nr:hypothetical protein BLOT_016359 [Blomia tropicalis]